MSATSPADLASAFKLPRDEGRSKVVPLAEAVRTHVQPGDTVHVGYCDARPNALILEVARAFAGQRPEFTWVTSGMVSVQHSLVVLGLVRRIVTSFAGENYPVARPNPALVRAVREGRVSLEHWSLYSLVARLAAGALGVPYFPVRSMVGSDMAAEAAGRGEFVEADGGDSGRIGLVSALRPDVVLIHAAAADAHGNLVIPAPYGEGHWGALAAKRGVVASVERIVSTEELRAMNGLVRIPAHTVRSVSLAPFGAHPFGFNDPGVPGVQSYTEDERFMADALKAAHDPESMRAWVDEWVVGVADEVGYRARLGEERLASLVRGEGGDAPRADVVSAWESAEPANATEVQVVTTARVLGSLVRAKEYDAVLSGVGLANLAAWLGVDQLKRGGCDVELMAEIGLFGYRPRPGEPFIFAGANVPTNKLLTDVMTVLGTLVPGPGTRTIGVVGAGQIDRTGAVNSTYGDDGGFLVGSGGANDVLTGADEVVITVAHDAARLVEKVSYRTCPGTAVRTIVTDLGILEREDNGEFVLTALLHTAGEDLASAVAHVRSRTGWDLAVARELRTEPLPTRAELALMRAFDPTAMFLRARGGRGA